MENKKPIIIAVIVLIIALTGLVFVGKVKDIRSGKDANGSFLNFFSDLFNGKAGKSDETSITTKESVVTEGVVTDVADDKVTLQNEIGEKVIENTPETTIYVIDATGLPIETNIAGVKKDAKALVIHEESVTRTKVVASNITQGAVIDVADGKISIQTANEGVKVVDITSNPTIYMGEGDQAVDKQVSDIKIGSEITVAYADAVNKLQVVGIRIDKL